MRTHKTSKLMHTAAAGALAGVLAIGAVSTASAQSYRAPTGLEPVVGCDAPGNKQIGGALIGALLGAAAGSNLAKNDRGTGTAIGAVAGAATGSYVGCRMQRADTQRDTYGSGYGYQAAPATYTHAGYRLDSSIAPAHFARDGGAFVATSSVNLRGAPTVRSARVGALRPGERFQALARVRGTDWVLVGQNGIGVGYVNDAYVRPIGHQYASYGY